MAEKVKLDVVFDDDFSAPAKKAGNASADLAAQMAKIDRVAKGTTGALSRAEAKLAAVARSASAASKPVKRAGNASADLAAQMARVSHRMSATPASVRLVTNATQKLSQRMERVEQSSAKATGALRRTEAQVKQTGRAAATAARRWRGLSIEGDGIHRVMQRVSAALSRVAVVAFVAMAAAVTAASAALATFVVRAGMLRQRATLAFDAMVGSGAERFQDLRRIALETGNTIGDVFDGIQGFVRAGFDFGTAERLFKRLQDLSMVGVTGETLKRITLAVAQIKGAGKLQGDELRQLMETGLNIEAVWDSIAQQMGVTKEEAKKLKEQGKVGADVAIKAIEAAVAKTTGADVAGAARADFITKTFAGAIARARGLWSIFMDDVAAQSGGAFASVEKVLRDIGDAAKAGAFDKYASTLGLAFDALGRGISAVWGSLKQMAAGFSEEMDAGGLEAINQLLKGMGFEVEDNAGLWREAGKWLARVAVGTVAVVAAMVRLAELASVAASWMFRLGEGARTASDTIMNSMNGLPATMQAMATTAGLRLIDGLVNGITAGAGRVSAAISTVTAGGLSNTIGFGAMPGMPTLPALPGGGMAPASMGLSALERGGQPSTPAVVGGAQGMDLSGLASMFTSSGDGGGGSAKTVNFDFNVNVEGGGGAEDVESTWQQLRWRVRREVELGIKNAGDM